MSNMNDIERLSALINEVYDLKRKIEKFSIYEAEAIGNIIAKLMSEYEGVSYEFRKNDYMSGRVDYSVNVLENNFVNPIRYRLGLLSKMKFRDLVPNCEEKKMCFLPPSGYLVTIDPKCCVTIINEYVDYVQKFIDYLYDIRSRENLTNLSKERLDVILGEFLDNTKEEQQARKIEIANKAVEKKERDERHSFEKLCMIDRTSIFNAITYIVNNYSDDMSAIQDKYSEWNRTVQWSNLTVYHKLSVKSDFGNVSFTTEVDRDGCYPDEEIGGVIVNYGKETYICYFELKSALSSLLENNPYCIMLMELIEDKYNDTKVLSATDVEELLGLVRAKKKERVKRK